MRRTKQHFLAIALASMLPVTASAQGMGDAGATWHGSWGFRGVGEESIALQRAQVMNQVANPPPAPITTNIFNTNTDNRSNYIENISDAGAITSHIQNGDNIDQIGDNIGTNTNAVGSLNTGSTTISVSGAGNEIHAINSADNTGCADASITTSAVSLPPVATAGDGTSGFGPFAALEQASIASRQHNC